MTIDTSFAPLQIGIPFELVPDDSRRIIHASLKNSSGLDGGFLTDSGGVVTYTDDGISNGGSAYIKWTPTATQIAELNKSAHIHLEIESDFMERTSASDRMLTLGAGGYKLYLGAGNNLWDQLDGSGATSLKTLVQYNNRPTTHTTLDFVFIGSKKYTYVDGLLILDEVRGAASNFATINLFSSQSGTEVWGGNERVKNFYVTTGSPIFLRHPYITNIDLYGDSLTQQGNLPAGYPDSNGVAGDANQDIAMTAAVIKKIQNKGIKANVQNHGIAGDTLADVQALIDATPVLAGHTVVINIGINNAKTGTLSPVQATFKTNYQTLIDDVTALGANHIFIGNLASTAEDVTTPEATSRPAVDEVNTVVSELVSENSNVSLLNISTLFGGTEPNLSYYKSANLHWSQEGSRVAGEYIGDQIIEHYTVA